MSMFDPPTVEVQPLSEAATKAKERCASCRHKVSIDVREIGRRMNATKDNKIIIKEEIVGCFILDNPLSFESAHFPCQHFE